MPGSSSSCIPCSSSCATSGSWPIGRWLNSSRQGPTWLGWLRCSAGCVNPNGLPWPRNQLHDLRQLIKRARYQLDNCKPKLGQNLSLLQAELKQLQQMLGDLHAFEVLRQALDDQLPGSLAATLPRLHELMAAHPCSAAVAAACGWLPQGEAATPMAMAVFLATSDCRPGLAQGRGCPVASGGISLLRFSLSV